MADKYSSLDDLLEQTGKTRLTPSEYRILKNRERSGGIEDTLIGSGKAYAGMLRDLYKSNIEGDEKYDRDWNWSDAIDPAMDALSVFGLRPAAAALKSKLAVGAAKGAGKGLQKGYNVATGAKRGAASKAAGGKKTLDAPDGKQGQLALPGPKGAATPAAKPGMMQKAGTAIKNNPIKSTIAGVAGLGGAAAGINAILPDEPKGLDPLEKTEDEIADPAANQNLDNPDGQMAMTPEGQRIKNINDAAQSLPANVPLGTGGATKANRARMNMQAEADRQMGDFIKQQKKQSDQNNFLRDRYDATGGRRAGAWDRLSEAQKDEMVSNYRKNSFYDSNPDAVGGTAVSDIARAELGMPSMEEQRLADLDAAVERQKMSQMGYGVAADPENYQGAIPSMTKEEFSKKSGMQNEGTGIVNTTLDGKGPVTTLEMGGQFDKAGGLETAKPFLSDVQQVNLERQLDRPGVFNDQFGQEQEMSKDTVRMTSDEQDYSDANFQNRDDALAYLNRGASLDEPAPESPESPEAPEAPEEEEGGFMKYLPYMSPLLLAHPATRKMGQKMLPKFKKNMKQLGDDFYDAVPMKTPGGYAPRLGNSPLKLPNKNPALPHRAPGLPHRADPNIPAALPSKSMSAPAGRQVTPEQFRRAQTGMGSSERAAAVGAKEAQERAAADRIAQMNRKAQLEREARARRLAGQPMNPNPYGVPGNQIHMNGQLPAKRPPFPL